MTFILNENEKEKGKQNKRNIVFLSLKFTVQYHIHIRLRFGRSCYSYDEFNSILTDQIDLKSFFVFDVVACLFNAYASYTCLSLLVTS